MYSRRMDLKGIIPCFFILIVFLSVVPLHGQHRATKKNACCPGQPDYDLRYGLRDETGRLAGWNDPVVGFIERRTPENTAHAIGQGLSLGVLPELKMVGNIGKIFGFGRNATESVNFSIDPKKFDYFFGRVVSGNSKNIIRSAQNLKDLKTLEIKNEKELMKILEKAFTSGVEVGVKTNKFGSAVIKSINVGKKGKIEVGFFFKENNFSNPPKVTTLIPKIF